MELSTFFGSFASTAGFGTYHYTGTWWPFEGVTHWRAVIIADGDTSVSPTGTLAPGHPMPEAGVRDAITAFLQGADADAVKKSMCGRLGSGERMAPAYASAMYSQPIAYRGFEIRILVTRREGKLYASYTVRKKGWRRQAHAVNDLQSNCGTEDETRSYARNSARSLVDLLTSPTTTPRNDHLRP